MPESDRQRWMTVPFIGCDGLPKTGQSWVRSGLLTATVYIRPNADLALEMLVEAIRTGSQTPESKLIAPESIPSIAQLARNSAARVAKSRAASAN